LIITYIVTVTSFVSVISSSLHLSGLVPYSGWENINVFLTEVPQLRLETNRTFETRLYVSNSWELMAEEHTCPSNGSGDWSDHVIHMESSPTSILICFACSCWHLKYSLDFLSMTMCCLSYSAWDTIMSFHNTCVLYDVIPIVLSTCNCS